MWHVRVIGWKEGRDVLPISFATAVREHCKLDLRQAKSILDRFCDEGEVTIILPDGEAASEFVTAVTELGARCETTPPTDGDPSQKPKSEIP